mmetsp:Transcript_32716/g.70723  ORF Transcript_32716/g.70723 Transcript_32716/m.70723 type:complete len:290 (+) Transcript_32716:3-872(+)
MASESEPSEKRARVEPLSAACLCKAIQWKVTPPFKWKCHCHCSICQRHTGAEYQSLVAVSIEDLVLTQGNIGDLISHVEKEQQFTRYSCGKCGSPIFGELQGVFRDTPITAFARNDQNVVDGLPQLLPDKHIFYGDRIRDHKDGLPKFVGFPGTDQLNCDGTPKSDALVPARPGFGTITPYLTHPRGEDLVSFMEQALDGKVKLRSEGGKGGAHIEVQVGDSMVMVGVSEDVCNAMLFLYVPDPVVAQQRAIAHGATELMPVTDNPDGRRGGVQDPFGNKFFFGDHKAK